MTEPTETAEDYTGLFSAFGYAFRQSGSRLFRLYAVASALLGVFLTVLILSALVKWLANPVGLVGERAFLGVISLLLLAPLFGPVLLVARHHRRTGHDGRYDRLLALAGFLFVLSLYVGLVVTVPPVYQTPPGGALGPVVAFLYGLPQLVGLVPPVVGAALILVAHRLGR